MAHLARVRRPRLDGNFYDDPEQDVAPTRIQRPQGDIQLLPAASYGISAPIATPQQPPQAVLPADGTSAPTDSTQTFQRPRLVNPVDPDSLEAAISERNRVAGLSTKDSNGRIRSGFNARLLLMGALGGLAQGGLPGALGGGLTAAGMGALNPDWDERYGVAQQMGAADATVARREAEMKAQQDREAATADIRVKNANADYQLQRPTIEGEKLDALGRRMDIQEEYNTGRLGQGARRITETERKNRATTEERAKTREDRRTQFIERHKLSRETYDLRLRGFEAKLKQQAETAARAQQRASISRATLEIKATQQGIDAEDMDEIYRRAGVTVRD